MAPTRRSLLRSGSAAALLGAAATASLAGCSAPPDFDRTPDVAVVNETEGTVTAEVMLTGPPLEAGVFRETVELAPGERATYQNPITDEDDERDFRLDVSVEGGPSAHYDWVEWTEREGWRDDDGVVAEITPDGIRFHRVGD